MMNLIWYVNFRAVGGLKFYEAELFGSSSPMERLALLKEEFGGFLVRLWAFCFGIAVMSAEVSFFLCSYVTCWRKQAGREQH